MKIYLTHPITGLTYDEVMGYYEPVISQLHGLGYEVLQPMLGKQYLRTEKGSLKAAGLNSGSFSTNHAIVARDQWMVQQCDLVYANLMGATKVSIGSVAELAWAKAYNKYVLLVMEEGNVHEHAFILECAGAVLRSHEAAMEYLTLFTNPHIAEAK